MILNYYLYLIFVFCIIILFFLLKKRNCPVCKKDIYGLLTKIGDEDLIRSNFVEEKHIYFLKKKMDIDKDGSLKICKDCIMELYDILIKKMPGRINQNVRRYFALEDLSEILFCNLKKSNFKPLLFIIFISSFVYGAFFLHDLNSWYSIVGFEGTLVYFFGWMIYSDVAWEGFAGKKGFVIYQKYSFLKIFYNYYDWVRVKEYEKKEGVILLHFNEIGLIDSLFSIEIKTPNLEKLIDILTKNKVPIKN